MALRATTQRRPKSGSHVSFLENYFALYGTLEENFCQHEPDSMLKPRFFYFDLSNTLRTISIMYLAVSYNLYCNNAPVFCVCLHRLKLHSIWSSLWASIYIALSLPNDNRLECDYTETGGNSHFAKPSFKIFENTQCESSCHQRLHFALPDSTSDLSESLVWRPFEGYASRALSDIGQS